MFEMFKATISKFKNSGENLKNEEIKNEEIKALNSIVALLVEAASIDGEIGLDEKNQIKFILTDQLNLETIKADEILEETISNSSEQIDTYAKQGTTIIPPVYLAKNVTLEGVTIGPNVSVELGCILKNTKISNSIVRDHAMLQGCSLAGSTIGAHTQVSDVRGEVHVGDHSIISTK